MDKYRGDPRKVLTDVTRIIGDPQMGEDIGSGRCEADFIMPLLAGILEHATSAIFLATVGGESSGFEASDRPMKSVVTLLDGTTITITLEASG